MPGIAAALVALGCRIEMMVEAGTHSIVTGIIAQIRMGEGAGALVYYDRRYHDLHQEQKRTFMAPMDTA